MLRAARTLLYPPHKIHTSLLLISPPFRRRRSRASVIFKSVTLLPSCNTYIFIGACFTKMDFTSGADPPKHSDTAEDYVHVSGSDLSEAMFRVEFGANSEDAAASVSVGAGEVIGGFEETRISSPAEGGLMASRALPDDLAKGVVHLECESSVEGGRCDVYLVGTAHVSQDSCTEVQTIIRYLKPEVVFLELCSSRIAILAPQNLKVPTFNEMIDMWKKKKTNTFGILYSWFLAKVAERLEVFPGAEFRVAFEEAISYGARVFLGDRPVNITLRRTWGKMSVWHKAKFLYYILFQTFFLPNPQDLNKMLKDMDNVDMLTLVIQEMSKAFPTIMETVLHERDMYMSSTLLKVAGEHSSIVAVVGKGHLPGIRSNWKQPVDMKLLLQNPGRRVTISRTKIIASGTAVAAVAVAYGIFSLMAKR